MTVETMLAMVDMIDVMMIDLFVSLSRVVIPGAKAQSCSEFERLMKCRVSHRLSW